jgi:porphobilinogen synthase
MGRVSSPESASFPTIRLRRVRHRAGVRQLVREVSLAPSQLVLPLFVRSGKGVRRPIDALPGHAQLSPDVAASEAKLAESLGLGGVILFGIPDKKDAQGSESWRDDGVVQQAIGRIKELAPSIPVVTDVCFCEYTDHGHCGVVKGRDDRTDVDNDATLELLARQAVSHAQAGADVVAPSGMIDGMVQAIRRALDAEAYTETPIMSYAAKYASAFYGPFREAAESTPQFGDRKSYQMDPAAGTGKALREIELDLAEGADIVMVKPALAYLDVIRAARERFPGVPLAAYNVSGEYSMVKAAAEKGWLAEKDVALESLLAIRRAGAGIILTYWAKDVAMWLG